MYKLSIDYLVDLMKMKMTFKKVFFIFFSKLLLTIWNNLLFLFNYFNGNDFYFFKVDLLLKFIIYFNIYKNYFIK